jgi:hypothetical protein
MNRAFKLSGKLQLGQMRAPDSESDFTELTATKFIFQTKLTT